MAKSTLKMLKIIYIKKKIFGQGCIYYKLNDTRDLKSFFFFFLKNNYHFSILLKWVLRLCCSFKREEHTNTQISQFY